MAINLLDVLHSQIGEDVMSKAAQFLGEDSSSIQKALGAALPSVLGGVAGQANNVSGASNLLNMLSSGGHDGSIFSNLSSLMGGGSATQGLVSSGSNIIRGLFGDKTSGIVDAIAAHAGIKSSSASSLLGMAAPMVLGVLGNHVSSNGLNASGLMGLLASHADIIKNALPASLSAALGLGGMQAAASNVATSAYSAANTSRTAATEVVEEASSGFGKYLPWLLLIAAAAVAWYLMKGCKDEAPAPPAAPVVTAPMVQAPPAIKMDTLKFPDGTFIVVKAGTFLESLYKEVADPKSSVGVHIAIDGVNFATGSSTISEDSKANLDDLAKIMKAYPKLGIEVDGYTDNVGNEAANKKLSEDRAKAVDAYLDTKAIAADRVMTKGFGSMNPIGDNTTEEGRAKNRRFDAVITKE